MNLAALTFSFFMLTFLLIGLSAARVRQSSVEDFLIGGRQIKPWLNALSAASTNCSGFMFIGLIGLSYQQGIYAFWFVIGIILGSLLVWYGLVAQLRLRAGLLKAKTYLDLILPTREVHQDTVDPSQSEPELVAGRRVGIDRWFAGVVILFFLSIYAAAQLKAGTKAMHSVFGWPAELGIWMSALLILIYCLSGGFRATVWSDAAQSGVMLIAMLLLAWVSLSELGGLQGMLHSLESQSTEGRQLSTLFPDGRGVSGALATGLGWTLVGVGCLGQPHVMIRPIALPSVEDVPKTRRIFFLYYIIFVCLSVLVGVCARALIPLGGSGFDPELALPALAGQQLPAALIGVVLAGVFASAVSTADSQVLSCSAVIGQDLRSRAQQSYQGQRLATVVVLVVVALIATWAPSNVFTLVILSWSALAAPFVPLAVGSCLGFTYTATHRLTIMLLSLSIFGYCRTFGAPFGLHELLCTWGLTGAYMLSAPRVALIRE
ncbi:MAG: sodium/proline symporter [Myxococcota bacterium]|nr:sodium/proline symporter [Myxococcota bacterium]